MTADDAPRFAELMAALGETFAEPISKVRGDAYFVALADLPIEQVEAAVVLALRRSKYFPRPAELRALVEGAPDDAASREWATFCREVSAVGAYCARRQPALSETAMETVRQVFGSWARACTSLPAPDSDRAPELMNWRKQFLAAYADVARRREVGQLAEGSSCAGLLSAIRAWEKGAPVGSARVPGVARRPQLLKKVSGE